MPVEKPPNVREASSENPIATSLAAEASVVRNWNPVPNPDHLADAWISRRATPA